MLYILIIRKQEVSKMKHVRKHHAKISKRHSRRTHKGRKHRKVHKVRKNSRRVHAKLVRKFLNRKGLKKGTAKRQFVKTFMMQRKSSRSLKRMYKMALKLWKKEKCRLVSIKNKRSKKVSHFVACPKTKLLRMKRSKRSKRHCAKGGKRKCKK